MLCAGSGRSRRRYKEPAALSPSRSPDSEATYAPLVTDGSTCRRQTPNATQERGAARWEEGQGPGSVLAGHDATARGLAGVYTHRR